jgi:hypothetical protein
MTSTDAQTRALPTRWDGLATVWRGWEYQQPAFVCPPPTPTVCERCGAPHGHRGWPTQSVNRARVALRATTTLADIEADDENRRRLGTLAHKRPSIALWRLHAWRCPNCGLDTIWDDDTDEWWNLDESDYGDDGSVRP